MTDRQAEAKSEAESDELRADVHGEAGRRRGNRVDPGPGRLHHARGNRLRAASELLGIEEFDEDIVEELRSRARDVLLTQAIASEEKIDDRAGRRPARVDGMDEELAYKLAARGIAHARRACRPGDRRAESR